MRIEIDNKSWYDLTDFDSYEALEELGEITGTSGIPDCIDLERDWDTIQEYLGLSEYDQQVVMAYAEVTDNFNPEEAMEAYVGAYPSSYDFAQSLCGDVYGEALRNLPAFLRDCIKWPDVWDCFLRHDYFESDGHYFRNL